MFTEPETWAYDLVLSPKINPIRSKDVRVVVSWVGHGDFYGGFIKATNDLPVIEGPSYLSDRITTGTNYYNFTGSDYKKDGIWYHGFQYTTGKTNAEAFTVDTSLGGGIGAYAFYVRVPDVPINGFRTSAKLKVEVFLSEGGITVNSRQFARPVKTFYLDTAGASNNPSARYWQVFNLLKPVSNYVSASNLVDINLIVTGPEFFQGIGPCTGRAGLSCRSASGPCDAAENCLAGQDACPPDANAGSNTVCRVAAGPCDLAENCNGTSKECPENQYKSPNTSCSPPIGGWCSITHECEEVGFIPPSL